MAVSEADLKAAVFYISVLRICGGTGDGGHRMYSYYIDKVRQCTWCVDFTMYIAVRAACHRERRIRSDSVCICTYKGESKIRIICKIKCA